MTLLGLMNEIFNFQLLVVLMKIFYYLDSLLISLDVIYDIYRQNIFLSNKRHPIFLSSSTHTVLSFEAVL